MKNLYQCDLQSEQGRGNIAFMPFSKIPKEITFRLFSTKFELSFEIYNQLQPF